MTTYATPDPVEIKLEVSIGHVTITASERGDAVVDVQPSDGSNADDRAAAEQVRVDFTRGRLEVATPRQRTWSSRRGGSVDVTIDVPTGSSAHGSLGVANLTSTGTLGDVHLRAGVGDLHLDRVGALETRSGKGDVHVAHASGTVAVTAGSGDLNLRELDGAAVIKNANGDTRVGSSGGELRVQSANGRITIGVARGTVVAKSANGNVVIDEVHGGSVTAESKLGNVEVGIPEGVAAWIDAHTNLGRVRNELDQADEPDAPNGTVDVRVRTSLGEILVRRPNAPTAASATSS